MSWDNFKDLNSLGIIGSSCHFFQQPSEAQTEERGKMPNDLAAWSHAQFSFLCFFRQRECTSSKWGISPSASYFFLQEINVLVGMKVRFLLTFFPRHTPFRNKASLQNENRTEGKEHDSAGPPHCHSFTPMELAQVTLQRAMRLIFLNPTWQGGSV